MQVSPSPSSSPSFGGLLVPLEMFRASVFAAALGEALAARARDVRDAKLVLVRHPAQALVFATVEGRVAGSDPAVFWRENAELALVASQVLPREVFLVYGRTEPPERREEAFLVAGQGRMLAADEARADQLGPDARPDAWPLSQLAAQIGISLSDLANGFAGGPRVEVPLLDPQVDDRQLLMVLAGRVPADGAETGAAPGPTDRTDTSGGAASPGAAGGPEDDAKRREKARQADRAARKARAEAAAARLAWTCDDAGLVVAPAAELDDADIVERYVARTLGREAPPGVPAEAAEAALGKRLDVVVPVSFLSEVFVDEAPLSRDLWQSRAEERTYDGVAVRTLPVHAPRIGPGTLVELGGRRLFTSRPASDLPPRTFLEQVLARAT